MIEVLQLTHLCTSAPSIGFPNIRSLWPIFLSTEMCAVEPMKFTDVFVTAILGGIKKATLMCIHFLHVGRPSNPQRVISFKWQIFWLFSLHASHAYLVKRRTFILTQWCIYTGATHTGRIIPPWPLILNL